MRVTSTKEEMKNWTYEKLKQEKRIIFECTAGSIAYGTNTATSDVDVRYIYVLPQEDILGLGYVPQVNNDTNDIMGYEVRRFLELLETANPTVLELLAVPQDVIRYKHPVYDLILGHRDQFITSKIRSTLGGYAKQQIQKARGQDKMMNWDRERMTRKGPEDFCFVVIPDKTGTMPLKKWLEVRSDEINHYRRLRRQEDIQLTHRELAVSKMDNMRDMYALYLDTTRSYTRGIVSDGGTSNELRLTAVPEGVTAVATLYYNQDGYSMHCKEYKKYEEWIKVRNDARWVESQVHGQSVDGKNLTHCVRLLRMSKEVAAGKGLIVRRPNREELLAIRRGEVDLEKLLEQSEQEIKEIDKLYENSNLPDSVPEGLINELLIDIRKRFDKPKTFGEIFRANVKALKSKAF